MSLERLFLDHLPVIEQVVLFIGRRHRLGPDAIDELRSTVHFKIIDSDYEVLRKFEGRSTMRTYLTAIVQRHFLDSRTARWGRWRPCARARRAGPAGVLLDQLLTRDGVAVEEAIVKVLERHEAAEPELRRLAAELPVRTPRRFVGEDQLVGVADGTGAAGDSALLQDEAQRAELALAAALATLGDEDRVILKYRFVHGLQVSQVARVTGLEQKPLYRRIDTMMKTLRQELEALGIDRELVIVLIGTPGADIGPVAWPDGKSLRSGRPCD